MQKKSRQRKAESRHEDEAGIVGHEKAQGAQKEEGQGLFTVAAMADAGAPCGDGGRGGE